MATLVFAAAGAALGGAVGTGAVAATGAIIGQAVGASLGAALDQKLLGAGSARVEGGRLDMLRIQSAQEGAPISQVYGTMRVGGQVIWARRFREEQNTSSGGKNSPKIVSYQYSVSLAIALCEGEVQRIGRVWADGNEISLDGLNWRLYRGTSEQMPDPLIEAVEGVGNVPAYRGTAYIVFEDLPLGDYGNRLPQFNFEVMRRVAETGEGAPVDPWASIKGVALMPGTGEYALATSKVRVPKGPTASSVANVNNSVGETDFAVSLGHLGVEMPQVRSVGLVVSWFGDDLRCGHCTLRPKVESNDADSVDMPWHVAGVSRNSAEVVSSAEGRPSFGGTPTDASVIEAIEAIHAQGQDVMFYPFILMDVPPGNTLPDPWTGGIGQAVFPWRGRISLDRAPGLLGSSDQTVLAGVDVARFMGTARAADFALDGQKVVYSGPNEWSFRRFILHYAWLCQAAGGVDSFCIGSEMRSLTQIRDAPDSFPAVAAFVSLASEVRAVLGPTTKITYAADWSEYFGYQPGDGSNDVFFHLDPLWASDDIDAIGIDNYMPLSDWRDGAGHADAQARSIYSLDYLAGNVAAGEGYDWYYASAEDRDAQRRAPIEDGAHGEDWIYRYKDLKNWWSQPHHNRVNGGQREQSATPWVPQSKPIWFTELGCAAIDKGTNQPNVFFDEKSSESAFPYYSSGLRDDFLQYRYYQAHWSHWSDETNNPVSEAYGGPMVDLDHAHAWAWDARPWPDFPNRLDVWSDGDNYDRGHWITGRVSTATVSAIVGEISRKAGVADVDVSGLHGAVDGYVISDTQSPRQSIQPLMLSHAFDAYECAGKIGFQNRGGVPQLSLTRAQMAQIGDQSPFQVVRAAAVEAPQFVQVSFVQTANNYQIGSATAGAPTADETRISKSALPIALSSTDSWAVAARWLNESQIAQDRAEFVLPPSLLRLGPCDVIAVTVDGTERFYRIEAVEDGLHRVARCVRVEAGAYAVGYIAPRAVQSPSFAFPPPAHVTFMDLPLLDGTEVPHAPHAAAVATPWTGRHAVYAQSGSGDFVLNAQITQSAALGYTESLMPKRIPWIWAEGDVLRVRMAQGELATQTRDATLNGANVAAIRAPGAEDWEMFQFREAELVGNNVYELRGFLRGQFGTEALMAPFLPAGSEFVLITPALVQLDVPFDTRGTVQNYRIGPASRPIDDDSYVDFRAGFDGVGLRPYAPARVLVQHDGSGGFDVSWTRRTRAGGDNWLGLEVPLGEESELYRVVVEKDGAVRAQIDVDTPSYSYAAAAAGVAAPFDISVSQISTQFGPGPATRITING